MSQRPGGKIVRRNSLYPSISGAPSKLGRVQTEQCREMSADCSRAVCCLYLGGIAGHALSVTPRMTPSTWYLSELACSATSTRRRSHVEGGLAATAHFVEDHYAKT